LINNIENDDNSRVKSIEIFFKVGSDENSAQLKNIYVMTEKLIYSMLFIKPNNLIFYNSNIKK
jgi:hypothetical protein